MQEVIQILYNFDENIINPIEKKNIIKQKYLTKINVLRAKIFDLQSQIMELFDKCRDEINAVDEDVRNSIIKRKP